jgi:hypothetical protein
VSKGQPARTPPELWYAQHCFWSLLHGRPEPVPGENVDADAVAFGVAIAMTGADRGGHKDPAGLVSNATVRVRVTGAC